MTLRELLYKVLPAGHRRLPEPPPRSETTPRTLEDDVLRQATARTAGQGRQDLGGDG